MYRVSIKLCRISTAKFYLYRGGLYGSTLNPNDELKFTGLQDGGKHLVVVDEANEHIISVWDLNKDKPHKITETKVSKASLQK